MTALLPPLPGARNAAPADGAREGPCPSCGRSEDETGVAPEAAVAAPPGRGGRRGSQNLAVLGVALVVVLGAGGSIAWSLSQEEWFRPKEWFWPRAQASAAAGEPRAVVMRRTCRGRRTLRSVASSHLPRRNRRRAGRRRDRAGETDRVPPGLLRIPQPAHPRGGAASGADGRARPAEPAGPRPRDRRPDAGRSASEVLEVDALCRSDRTGIAICRDGGGERMAILNKAAPVRRPDAGRLQDGRRNGRGPRPRRASTGLCQTRGRGPAGSSRDGGRRLPDGIGIRLTKMTFVEAFAALRQLHGAIRSDGPSPRLVQALVRAYANLGLLTEYQWDAASRAYKARALLYAQGLVAAEPKSPAAYRHRAYAAALAGVHWWAIEDLDEARRLVEAQPAAERPKPPGWVPLLELSCRYDVAGLDAARKRGGPDDELAGLLYMLSLEQPPRRRHRPPGGGRGARSQPRMLPRLRRPVRRRRHQRPSFRHDRRPRRPVAARLAPDRHAAGFARAGPPGRRPPRRGGHGQGPGRCLGRCRRSPGALLGGPRPDRPGDSVCVHLPAVILHGQAVERPDRRILARGPADGGRAPVPPAARGLCVVGGTAGPAGVRGRPGYDRSRHGVHPADRGGRRGGGAGFAERALWEPDADVRLDGPRSGLRRPGVSGASGVGRPRRQADCDQPELTVGHVAADGGRLGPVGEEARSVAEGCGRSPDLPGRDGPPPGEGGQARGCRAGPGALHQDLRRQVGLRGARRLVPEEG